MEHLFIPQLLKRNPSNKLDLLSYICIAKKLIAYREPLFCKTNHSENIIDIFRKLVNQNTMHA